MTKSELWLNRDLTKKTKHKDTNQPKLNLKVKELQNWRGGGDI